MGGFIALRHNHIRHVTAELLNQVTKDLRIEQILRSLIGETFEKPTANTSDNARLDISARGLWTKWQMAFFDVRVVSPNAKRFSAQSLQRLYISNEKENKCLCNIRVLQVENGASHFYFLASVEKWLGKHQKAISKSLKCCPKNVTNFAR